MTPTGSAMQRDASAGRDGCDPVAQAEHMRRVYRYHYEQMSNAARYLFVRCIRIREREAALLGREEVL